MIALDRTKPYGSIFGDEEGRAFEQDGVFFNTDGSEWQPMPGVVNEAQVIEEATNPVQTKPASPARAALAAARAVPEQAGAA